MRKHLIPKIRSKTSNYIFLNSQVLRCLLIHIQPQGPVWSKVHYYEYYYKQYYYFSIDLSPVQRLSFFFTVTKCDLYFFSLPQGSKDFNAPQWENIFITNPCCQFKINYSVTYKALFISCYKKNDFQELA